MQFNWYTVMLIAITAVITFLLRAIPFMIFGGGKKMPDRVKKVADLLPAAIMTVLVIYCIKGELLSIATGVSITAIGSAVALLVVVAVHLWKRNTLVSIGVGTVIYMVLIRVLPMWIK
ncbi:MAG: AzlD domain-containing protein [Lachnospiraceae bacterium]|nr:AzlD domain-containing protein [Lachnospiraceae bacterium]